MAKHEPFVIPAGVKFHVTANSLSIEHQGDIILHDSLGRELVDVVSHEGSITLRGNFRARELRAQQGTIRLEGSVQLERVDGRVVEIAGRKLRARAVRAAEQITVGPTQLTVDVLLAPRIVVDPRASGRVPVIECHNELGPNAIKGGFSVAEYDELIGDARAFLAERGLEPLPPGPSRPAEDEEEDDESPSSLVIEARPVDEDAEEDAESSGEPLAAGAGAEPAPALAEWEDDPATNPGLSLAVHSAIRVEAEPPPPSAPTDEEDLPQVQAEELDEAASELEADPLQKQLREVLGRLDAFYEGRELPPPIVRLRELVEARAYEEVRTQLPQLWKELVQYHRQHNLRIRQQVTTTFNNVMSLVKQGA